MRVNRWILAAVIAAVLALGAAVSIAVANSTGTWCYTHECQMASLDSGPPYLTNDGDADADDSTTPPPPGQIKHVVIIMEENHSASSVTSTAMPYLSSLGVKYAKFSAYQAISHPSLPNYMAITSGSTQGRTTDCGTSTAGCTTAADNLYHQAGAWSQLSESMPTLCDHSNAGAYVVHHAPAPYFTDLNATCSENDRPLVKTAVPQLTAAFTFITPNNLDNAHSGSLQAADSWLKTVVPQIQAEPTYQDGSTLIEITFDEGSGNNNVYLALVNPALAGKGTIAGTYTHYSLLRMNEELLGLPLLGNAATAPDMRKAVGL